MGNIKGVPIEVVRTTSATDEHGNEAADVETYETVDNVLIAPTSTSDLEASRPDGVRVDMVFHFPKTYRKSLRGTHIVYNGVRYAVIGDPQTYLDELTPLEWNRAVNTEVTDG